MAYDPEAREQSNSAMIIGVVALLLLVVGAIAYFSTQNTIAEPTHTTVVTSPPERIEKTTVVPANPAPPVVIDRPVPVPAEPSTRVIERDTHTTVTHDSTDTAPGATSGTTSTTTTTHSSTGSP